MEQEHVGELLRAAWADYPQSLRSRKEVATCVPRAGGGDRMVDNAVSPATIEIMNPVARRSLRDRIERLCVKRGTFTLSTGQTSDLYFDCKPALLNGATIWEIASAMLEEVANLPIQPDAVGGLAVGADPLVTAITMLAARRGLATSHGCVVRKEPKAHGTRKIVENEPPDGTSVVVVDDVFTTGRSTAYACEMLQQAGAKVVGIIGLIDRQEGGVDYLRREFQVSVRSLFKSSDFT